MMRQAMSLQNFVADKGIIDEYLRESIHMWSGEPINVTLRASNRCRHVIMLKFGRNIFMHDDGDDGFRVCVKVVNSAGFYQWLASYGTNIVIESPIGMKEKYVEYLKNTLAKYE